MGSITFLAVMPKMCLWNDSVTPFQVSMLPIERCLQFYGNAAVEISRNTVHKRATSMRWWVRVFDSPSLLHPRNPVKRHLAQRVG